jgi:hypothetical protein
MTAQTTLFSRRLSARALPTTTRKKQVCRLHKKGGEAPKGACQPWAAHRSDKFAPSAQLVCCAAARHTGRARLPALRPRLSQGLPSQLSSRPCFLRLGQRMIRKSGHRFSAESCAAKSQRALPALSCPSPVTAPHASALVPKGLMPEAAPARLARPRGSTAPAPHFGSHPECVPLSERDGVLVTDTGTNVKIFPGTGTRADPSRYGR